MASWSLPLTSRTFNLAYTLGGGQSFRWKEVAHNEWVGVLGKSILLFKQFPDRTECRIMDSADDNPDKTKRDVEEFLRLETDLEKLYKHWSERDQYFRTIEERVSGIRLLRQDPVETIFSFICSTNNNIPRISAMVNKLCRHYGEAIGSVDEEMYYSFPPVKDLTGAEVEGELRAMGFGYRARYVRQTAVALLDKGEEWLAELRDTCDYLTAREALISLPGVGPKVADCICLMSLDKHEAVPVDTHVWQVAKRQYGFSASVKESKTISSRMYMEIGDHFRSVFGKYAGWAQTVLFCRELAPPKHTTRLK